MEEAWKDIEGYEGKYRVSTMGRVESLTRTAFNGYKYHILKGRILRLGVSTVGYPTVVLTKDCIQKSYSVHRLVAKAFIENPENKDQVNHIDGIKKNSYVTNLEWSTRCENIKHAYNNGLKLPPSLGNSGVNHHRSLAVIKYDLQNNKIERYESINLASLSTRINRGTISAVASNNRGTAGGFIWKYESTF